MCKPSGSTWWFQGVDGGLTTIIFKPRVILEEVSHWFTSWLVLADQQKPMIQTVQPVQPQSWILSLLIVPTEIISLKDIL